MNSRLQSRGAMSREGTSMPSIEAWPLADGLCLTQAEYIHGIAEAFSSGQLTDEGLVGERPPRISSFQRGTSVASFQDHCDSGVLSVCSCLRCMDHVSAQKVWGVIQPGPLPCVSRETRQSVRTSPLRLVVSPGAVTIMCIVQMRTRSWPSCTSSNAPCPEIAVCDVQQWTRLHSVQN